MPRGVGTLGGLGVDISCNIDKKDVSRDQLECPQRRKFASLVEWYKAQAAASRLPVCPSLWAIQNKEHKQQGCRHSVDYYILTTLDEMPCERLVRYGLGIIGRVNLARTPSNRSQCRERMQQFIIIPAESF